MKNVAFIERVFITGGTGSLGKAFLKRLASNDRVEEITVFSRDEAKQDAARKEFDDPRIDFVIGDVRDRNRVMAAVAEANPSCLVHAAALKQVPSCENFPYEAVRTNIEGAKNVIDACNAITAIAGVPKVVAISTDKACKPINAMGISKAMQEKLFISAQRTLVRYGNVLASRGSVIPFFHDRIRQGKTLPVTGEEMTRFFLSLNRAVDTIMAAIEYGGEGEIFVPQARSARIETLASILNRENGRDGSIPLINRNNGSMIEYVPVRPGEKTHEILISEEESKRLRFINPTGEANKGWHVIVPHGSKAEDGNSDLFKNREFCSADFLMDPEQIRAMLSAEGLLHVE